MKQTDIYETHHKESGHFSFGKNWQSFLTTITPKRIAIAKASIADFLGGNQALKNKTFLDLGSGSGIFSLAAKELGAKTVTSVDIDQSSIDCARLLKEKAGQPDNWRIKKGSALNAKFMQSLGQFDVVYSWGVLHHTGKMYQAIEHAIKLVKPNGQFYIAIYNDSTILLQGKSPFWLKAKRHYNQSNQIIKRLYEWFYSSYLFLALLANGKNPVAYIANYQSARGMSWKHDILDWLGGYPYEYARPDEIITFFSKRGFSLIKTNLVTSIGCNEYLFKKNPAISSLPPVTALLSVHNNAKTLEKALESIFNQTLKHVSVVCINDASTDATANILARWQKKKGAQFKVITNKNNLGLTRSLNLGLSFITTPYTARIDADDWWEPTKLEKQVSFLELNPDYGIIGTWYTNLGSQKKIVKTPPVTNRAISQSLLYQNPFAHSSVVFRTNFIKQQKGYNPRVRYGQDYELWLRCLNKTKFFNIPENLSFRLFTGGISIEKQKDQMRSAIKTRSTYIKENHLPFYTYRSLLEPWLVGLMPRWITDRKRQLQDRR